MADPLSLLRLYHSNWREILEEDGNIIFGEFSWPKNAKTNFMKYGSNKEGQEKQYYTLECLLYLLKNVSLGHPVYIKNASAENIPVVTRADRKDVLAYLDGEIATCDSIDTHTPLELLTPFTVLSSSKRASQGSIESPAKKPCLEASEDVLRKVKYDLATMFDTPGKSSVTFSNINSSICETIPKEKLDELKIKREAIKRTKIKVPDAINVPPEKQQLLDFDLDFTKGIMSRERQWRNRSTILQSKSTNFDTSISALSSLEARAAAKLNPPVLIPTVTMKKPIPKSIFNDGSKQPGYSRYEQERLTMDETEGFKINVLGTYHGMTVKSMEAGPKPKKLTTTSAMSPSAQSNLVDPTVSNKRMSRTPIIIIPPINSSLITMYNCRDILEDLQFVTTDDKRDNEVLIQRRKNGVTVPYRVIDNPQKLTLLDWERVVAVFVLGPPWQFKGWPWDGNPVDIFSKISAFHLKYDDQNLDKNVAKWAVTVIQLSRTRRYLDKAALMTIWSKLDVEIARTKPSLRY